MSWADIGYVAAMTTIVLVMALVLGYGALRLHGFGPRPAPAAGPQRWSYGDIAHVVVFYLGVMVLAQMCAFMLTAQRLPTHAVELSAVVSTTFANVCVCLYIIVLGEFRRGKTLGALGLSRRDWAWHLGLGIYLYVCFCPVVLASMQLVQVASEFLGHGLPAQPLVRLVMTEHARSVMAAVVALVVVVAPLTEEVIFRGFLFSALRDKMGRWSAIVLSAALFAMAHMSLSAFVPVFLLGLLLAWVFDHTETLVASMAIHLTHNTASVLWILFMRLH